LACPWNKYAQRSTLPDFDARAPIAQAHLLDVWRWSEADFERHTEGSAIRRIGHERWLRNVAIALGNAVRSAPDAATQAVFLQALAERADHPSALVQEHRRWAMAQADRALTTEPTPPRPKAG
jgi:epoxyqueuosine reductase